MAMNTTRCLIRNGPKGSSRTSLADSDSDESRLPTVTPARPRTPTLPFIKPIAPITNSLPRRTGLSRCECDELQFPLTLNLQHNRSARGRRFQCGAQTIQRGHRLTIKASNHVSRCQRNLRSRTRGARRHNNSVRIAEVVDLCSDVFVDLNGQNPKLRYKVLFRIRERGYLVHLVRALLQRNVETHLCCATQDPKVSFLSRFAREHVKGDVGQVIRVFAIDGQKDIADTHAGGFRGTARSDIGNDDPVISRKTQALRHFRRNRLELNTDFRPVQVAVLAQLLVHNAHYTARYREAKSFVTTRLRQDECIYPDDFAGAVDQRASRISRINRGVCLYVNHGRVGVGLPSNR